MNYNFYKRLVDIFSIYFFSHYNFPKVYFSQHLELPTKIFPNSYFYQSKQITNDSNFFPINASSSKFE